MTLPSTIQGMIVSAPSRALHVLPRRPVRRPDGNIKIRRCHVHGQKLSQRDDEETRRRAPTPIPQIGEVREPRFIGFAQNLYTERTVGSPPAPAVPPIVTTARVPPFSVSVSTIEAEPAHAVPPIPVRA
jgi:hypothetical protein